MSSPAGNVVIGPDGGALNPADAASYKITGGRRSLKAKTLKRMLKKAGMKVSGKKATLRARAKKAHLIRGGAVGLSVVSGAETAASATGGRRRTRRRSLFRKFW